MFPKLVTFKLSAPFHLVLSMFVFFYPMSFLLPVRALVMQFLRECSTIAPEIFFHDTETFGNF